MQRSRNIFLVISLSILILISFGLVFFTKEESKLEIDRHYFSLGDTEKMDEVKLLSNGGEIDLKFENGRWRVNDTWDADMKMIKVLFATLRQIEARRPVAAVLRDSVSQRLVQHGTRVSIGEEGSTRLSFLAGGNIDKTEAWFLKEGDTQPFVVTIPGYRVYAAGIFEMELSGWRDKRVFNFNWRNFKSLSFDYTNDAKSNFEVEMKDNYFGIKNMTRTDTTKMNNFLDAVSLLYADRYIAAGKPFIDSLISTTPMARLEIRDVAGKTYSLNIFQPRNKDVECYGLLSSGDIVALNKKEMGEIVRRKDYFLPGK